MKYLRLVDHLGNEVLKLEVFVEGQDFEWQSAYPQAFWLGKVQLVDKIPEPEKRDTEEIIEEAKELIVRIEEALPEPVLPVQEGEPKPEPEPEPETVEEADAQLYGDEWNKQPVEEVTSEPETVSDKGTGDEGPGAPEQPESVEDVPLADKLGKPTKRDKRPRKRKAA